MAVSALTKVVNLGKIKEIYEAPNFLELQLASYRMFLRDGVDELLKGLSPIKEAGSVLELTQARVEDSSISIEDAMEKGLTYQGRLKATARLKLPSGEIKEQEVILANIPLISKSGTFVVNGTQRVVVGQLTRSPGIYFEKVPEEQPGSLFIKASLIPDRGTWMDFETEMNGVMWVRMDKKSRRVPITTLLKAIGQCNSFDIIKTFSAAEEIELDLNNDSIPPDCYLHESKISENIREVLKEKDNLLNDHSVSLLKEKGFIKVSAVKYDIPKALQATLKKDSITSSGEAYLEIYKKLKPGEMHNIDTAKRYLNQLLFETKRNDLKVAGRYKLNKRLGLNTPLNITTLTPEDFIAITRVIINLYEGVGYFDDIDHLGNRRVRLVGELLLAHLKGGLAKLERIIRDKMTTTTLQDMSPTRLVSSRPLTTACKEFFTTSQLSQFLDEINPLASLTHKRRLSSLGPGGLHRERAGIEVRDVHHSHYGRICPIETPEGANIGLINSLATYSFTNEHGFLLTPYFKVIAGRRTQELVHLTADEERNYHIADATTPMDEDGNILVDEIMIRKGADLISVHKEKVDLIDVSPKQVFSISAALIPFLEHDDANRALMGSNMYRQAVPLLYPEPPLVGTGLEKKVAMDSGEVVLSSESGVVDYVDASKISVLANEGNRNDYTLAKLLRTNQSTVFNQFPVVEKGQKVEKGHILADSQATSQGELSLGRNILVAFMIWEGYNYEDAIIISERLVKDDVFTSLHMEEYEVHTRELKVGQEEITNDIPGESEEALKDLDENGIVRIGAEVKAGDILVGKVSPRGEGELSPEDRILRAIFGEKASSVKNTSLRLPPGEQGIVVGASVRSIEERDELPSGVLKSVKVRVAQKRKITVGDKMAGRHGNKGVVAKILSEADMPFLEDGTPVDMVLNPLGVPSRMNVGQILEMYLGLVAHILGVRFAIPIFDGPKINEVKKMLSMAGLPEEGKVILRDGRTGHPFINKISIGRMYMFKLIHLVEDKIHARAIGPYSLITQQPLGGKSHFGGQRFGEMEVWALEGHGAAYTLQEMLTIKSDDISGRNRTFRDIVKGEKVSTPGCPESFKVLIQELRSLGLDVVLLSEEQPKTTLKLPLVRNGEKVSVSLFLEGEE